MNVHKELLQCLELVQATVRTKDACGICNKVVTQAAYLYPYSRQQGLRKAIRLELHALMKEWPKYSGEPNFPVPSTKRGENATCMYHTCMHPWSRKTKYGKLRHELLQWLIEETRRLRA